MSEITLNNSNLYVKGNLDVQGSISGVGSVYVNETTHVRGDSNIRYSSIGEESTGDIDPNEGVGLFSKGDILLEGYDGEQYLEDYVLGGPGSPVRKAWDDSKQALEQMDGLLEAHQWDGFDPATKDEFDSYRRVLGQDIAFPGAIPGWASGQEQLRVVADAVAAQPSNSEQRFLKKKLNELADNFDAGASFYPGTGMGPKHEAVENFLGKGDLRGVVDSALDIKYDGVADPLDDTFRIAALQVQQLDLKGMGHSYFQGVIYTEGSLQVKTNLQIVGGILAAGESTGGPFPGPGDILLENGVSIVYPRDQFRYGRGVGGTGQLGVSAWIAK